LAGLGNLRRVFGQRTLRVTTRPGRQEAPCPTLFINEKQNLLTKLSVVSASTVGDRDRILAQLEECIDACEACIDACADCADQCLELRDGEQVTQSFLSALDCEDICTATVNTLLRYNGYNNSNTRATVEACRVISAATALELEQSGELGGVSERGAVACRRVEDACASLIRLLIGTRSAAR
jgi:hypothetical protein